MNPFFGYPDKCSVFNRIRIIYFGYDCRYPLSVKGSIALLIIYFVNFIVALKMFNFKSNTFNNENDKSNNQPQNALKTDYMFREKKAIGNLQMFIAVWIPEWNVKINLFLFYKCIYSSISGFNLADPYVWYFFDAIILYFMQFIVLINGFQ